MRDSICLRHGDILVIINVIGNTDTALPKWLLSNGFTNKLLIAYCGFKISATLPWYAVRDITWMSDFLCTWPSEVWHLCEWHLLICIFDFSTDHLANQRRLKWAKTTKFWILRNASSLSATSHHSSKWYPWYPRLILALLYVHGSRLKSHEKSPRPHEDKHLLT